MRAQPRWGVLPLLAAPVGAWALGLGDIELESALNQPFRAHIGLVSPTAEDLQGLSVTLANQATFERYGLERPAFLSNMNFSLGRDAAGRDVITITSTESISEPFVTMLVEATWPSGRSLREYTVLLDPPVLLPEPAVEAPVQPAQSQTPEASAPGGPIRRPQPEPAPRAAPNVPPRSAPAPAPSTPSVSDGGSYGPVQRAETLWGIAGAVQPSGVSINQMMVAIYQANPQAFDDNINRLRAGAVLRIPSASEAGGLSAANATVEVRRQNEAWLGGSGGQEQARLRLVPPSEEAGAALGGGDAGGQAGADVSALQNELDATQEELEESRRLLELRNQELEQLQNQLAAARAAADSADAVGDASEPPAAADPGVDLEVEVDDEAVFADETPAESSVVEPEADEPAPAVAPSSSQMPPVATTSEPSLVSRIMDIATRPFVLIGVGIGVLLLAALLFLRRRRDDDAVDDVTGRWEAFEAEAEAEEDEIAATTRLRKQAQESDDFVVVEAGREEPDADDTAAALLADDELDEVDDFTRIRQPAPEAPAPEASDDTLSSQTVINLDQADPIAEADFHMAYGLYDQAAELVSNALKAQPDNRGLKLKLLEVFFVWGNKEAFLDAAQAFRSEMGNAPDGDWDKVIIMGKQICPDEALFADATAAAGEVDLDLEAGESEPALDLAFDEQTTGDEEDTGTHAHAADDLDLDFGSDTDLALEPTGERTSSASRAADDEMDLDDDSLDIGAQTSAGLEAALFGIDDDAATATTPDVDVDLDSLAETQESPTVEAAQTGLDDEDWAGVTMESPTVEQAGPEGDTVEMSAVDDSDSPTVESPTVESAAFGDSPTVESSTVESETSEPLTVEQTGMHSSADLTAELDLDDLGLDVKDLEDLPTDLGDLPSADDATSDTREQPALEPDDDDDDLLSATGVTQVLRGDEEGVETVNTAVLGDDDAAMMASELGDDDATSMSSSLGDDDATMMAPGLGDDSTSGRTLASTEVLESVPEEGADASDSSSVDLNLDDLSSALEGGDTVEQPHARSFGGDIFDDGDGYTPVDLDVGDDVLAGDDPTGTEEVNLDPQTMTEVGTKLDLARAYIDMGDPEGARSILEEVLDEGDSGQKREAQTLIDVLSA